METEIIPKEADSSLQGGHFQGKWMPCATLVKVPFRLKSENNEQYELKYGPTLMVADKETEAYTSLERRSFIVHVNER